MENSTHFPTKPPERSDRISVTREGMLPLGTETLHVCYLGKHTIMRPNALDSSREGGVVASVIQIREAPSFQ